MVRLGLVDMVNSQKPRVTALAADLAAPVVAPLDRHLEFLVEPRPIRNERPAVSPEVVVRTGAMRLNRRLHLVGTSQTAERMGARCSGSSPDGLSASLTGLPVSVGESGMGTSLPLDLAFLAAEMTLESGDVGWSAGELLSAHLTGDGRVAVVPPPCERVLGSQLGQALRPARRRPAGGQAGLDVDVLAADRAGNYDMAPTKGVMTRRPTELMLVGFDSTGRTFERLAA